MGAALENRRPSLVRENFPTGNFGGRALRKCSWNRKPLRERSEKRKVLRKRSEIQKALRKRSGRLLRVPRFLGRAVMDLLLFPRAPGSRGAGNAPKLLKTKTALPGPKDCA